MKNKHQIEYKATQYKKHRNVYFKKERSLILVLIFRVLAKIPTRKRGIDNKEIDNKKEKHSKKNK